MGRAEKYSLKSSWWRLSHSDNTSQGRQGKFKYCDHLCRYHFMFITLQMQYFVWPQSREREKDWMKKIECCLWKQSYFHSLMVTTTDEYILYVIHSTAWFFCFVCYLFAICCLFLWMWWKCNLCTTVIICTIFC